MDKLIVLVVLVVVVALSGCMEDVIRVHDTYNLTYINASNISYSGLVNVQGNISNISEINNGNWSADESNTPFWINITFTNITHFDFPEIKMLYYSTVGASTHVNDIEIYCITENAFVDLTTFTNQIEWTYWTRHIPDSMHFIDANGNVTIRLNHTANGNTNHRIKLDVVRLVDQPQFETVTTTLTQYFITNTTGGGGGVSFDGNPVDLNGSNMYNGTISNYSTLSYTNTSLDLKVNKSGDTMTGQLDIFGLLNTTTWNATQQPLFKNIYNISYNHNFTDPCTDNASGNCPVIIQEMGTNKSVITVKHRLNPANDAYGILVNAEITNVTTLQNNSKTGWGFFARPTNDDFYVGRFTPGLSEFTIRVISNTTFAVSQRNTTVINISASQNISSSRLTGVGNAYVCVDSSGTLFRGSPGC